MDAEDRKRETGTVKWFHAEKGYGFITRDSADTDAFVHISQVEPDPAAPDADRTLIVGQRVEFEMVAGRKGPQAGRVSVIV